MKICTSNIIFLTVIAITICALKLRKIEATNSARNHPYPLSFGYTPSENSKPLENAKQRIAGQQYGAETDQTNAMINAGESKASRHNEIGTDLNPPKPSKPPTMKEKRKHVRQFTQKISKPIKKEDFWFMGNIGGSYAAASVASRPKVAEADHTPPYSTYKDSSNPLIRNLKRNQMPAVSIDYDHHRNFITTGNSHASIAARNQIKAFMDKGDFAGGLDKNIEFYKTNPDQKTGKPGQSILEHYREGFRGAVNYSENMGLITTDQKNRIIKKYDLDKPSMAILSWLNPVGKSETLDFAAETCLNAVNRLGRRRG